MLLCTLLLLLMLVSWSEHNGATRVKVYLTHVMHWFTIGRAEVQCGPPPLIAEARGLSAAREEGELRWRKFSHAVAHARYLGKAPPWRRLGC
jgi:hypothetical protein